LSEVVKVGGSGEIRLITILVVVTLAVGVLGIFAVPIASTQDRSGDYIESYTATLHPDGRLDEVFVYTLKSSDTRMLFRYWDETLSFTSLFSPQIVPISVGPPPGSIAYVKDYKSRVTIMPPSQASGDDISTIASLAYINEAGCYKADYFAPGSYTIGYAFKIVMEIESDSDYDHLNLMLAIDHLPYRNVRIAIVDAGYVYAVYAHPPSLEVGQEGSNIVISGSSAEDELLEFELLMPSGAHSFEAYSNRESDVKGLTEQANLTYSRQFWTAYWLGYPAKAAVLLTPFLLLGLWIRYGREEDVTVPTYLSTVPNPERKPWLVNLVFRKGVSDLDEDGFYATLLDLQRRKKIRIEPREGGMKIFILSRDVEDAYEQKTMEFLGKLATLDVTSPDNPQAVFDTDTLKELAGKISSGSEDSRASEDQKDLLTLTNYKSPPWSNLVPIIFVGVFFVPWLYAFFFGSLPSGMMLVVVVIFGIALIGNTFGRIKQEGGVGGYGSKEWAKVSEAFFVKGRRRVWPIAVLGVLLLFASLIPYGAPIASYLLWTPALLGAVVLGQAGIAYSFPSTLFGRWREGMYKEKREWDAFRAHLGDLSQLRRYSTEDLSMWGSWLVYGTALGVGDKVAEAMKALNVKFDAAPVAMQAYTHFHPMMIARPPVSSGGGGGHGGGGRRGGGHGGGGGRGGGGGGRR
jgi:uncharacterized membrane protein